MASFHCARSNLSPRLSYKWTEIMQPDDKEAVITKRSTVSRWRCKDRMASEDKITTNTIEVLRSDMNRLGAKMAEEVV